MSSPEPIENIQEKVEEPWKPPPRPGQPGIGYDELGAEMAPNARVWKKYVEETDRMDQELVDGWNKSLDIILIFAALFSAISTAFVIESSKDLKPDYSETSARTLEIMSQTLSAIARGSPLNDSDTAVAGTQEFTPSSSAVAVNALWFLSLGLSVAVSLIAILAKEWCHSFMTGRVGSMLRQARLRQQRWDGIEQWKMKEILYVLPLLMHTALSLFAVGLSLYLWDINVRVALPVVVTTSLAALFYVATVSLPLFFRFCPYTTALARFLYPYWLAVLANRHSLDIIGALVASLGWISHTFVWMMRTTNHRFRSSIQGRSKDDIEATGNSHLHASPFPFRDKMKEAHDPVRNWVDSMRAMFSTDRSQLVEKDTPMDSVTSSMIVWMVVNCEDSRSVDMALQALAGADRPLPRLPIWECGAADILCQRVEDCIHALAYRHPSGLLAANDIVLDNAFLFSRSLSFLTTYVAGEGLDMTEASKPCFAVKDDQELAARLQNTAHHASICLCYDLGWILNNAWNQATPRYELVAYGFNDIPVKADEDMWNMMGADREQCQRQQELVRLIASGKVSGLPPGAIVALINGIAKTCLYNTSQSPVLLLDLFDGLEAHSNSTSKYIASFAIGLAVVGLLTGSYEGEDSSKEDKMPTNGIRRDLAMDTYTHLVKGLDFLESQTLLCFGLLSLLDPKTNGVWTFSAAEVRLIGSHLDRLVLRHPYHDVLPNILPASFGCGDHLAQIISRLFDCVSPDTELDPNSKSVSPSLLRVEAALSRPVCYMSDARIVPLLTQHFSSANSTQLKRLCLRGIKYSLDGGSD